MNTAVKDDGNAAAWEEESNPPREGVEQKPRSPDARPSFSSAERGGEGDGRQDGRATSAGVLGRGLGGALRCAVRSYTHTYLAIIIYTYRFFLHQGPYTGGLRHLNKA